MKDRADAVIVGGGVSGTSIAYHLAKLGINRVILLERENIAAGATGKSASIITHYFYDPLLIELDVRSGETLKNFSEYIGVPAEFHPSDFYYLLPERSAARFRETLALYRRWKVAIEELPLRELDRLAPPLVSDGIALLAVARDAGHADAYSIAMGYAQAAEQLGVEICRGTALVGVKTRNGRISAAVTDKGEIATECVVNAAGPWARAVARLAGVDLPLQLLRHQVLLFQPLFELNFSGTDLYHNTYFRPEAGGRILVGGGQDDDKIIADPNFYNHGTDMELVADLGARMATRMPSFAEAEFVTGWAGLLDVSPDWHPIYGSVPWLQGFYLACGMSGHGFHLAPMTGLSIAELIAYGKYKTVDLARLGIERFERGEFFERSFLDT